MINLIPFISMATKHSKCNPRVSSITENKTTNVRTNEERLTITSITSLVLK